MLIIFLIPISLLIIYFNLAFNTRPFIIIESTEFEYVQLKKNIEEKFTNAASIQVYEEANILNIIFSFFNKDIIFSKRMCFKIVFNNNKLMFEDCIKNKLFLTNKAYYFGQDNGAYLIKIFPKPLIDNICLIFGLPIIDREFIDILDYKQISFEDARLEIIKKYICEKYKCINKEGFLMFYNNDELEKAKKILPEEFVLLEKDILLYQLVKNNINSKDSSILLQEKLSNIGDVFVVDNKITSDIGLDFYSLIDSAKNHYFIELVTLDYSNSLIQDLDQGKLLEFENQYFKITDQYLITKQDIKKAYFLYRYKKGLFVLFNKKLIYDLQQKYSNRFFGFRLYTVTPDNQYKSRLVFVCPIKSIDDTIYIKDMTREEAIVFVSQKDCNNPEIIVS